MRDLELASIALERVLVVGAHPDDAEFSAGGLCAELVDRGVEVHLLVCTDGGRGGRGLEDAINVRASEQQAAAREIGFAHVQNLGHPDGELQDDEVLRAELVRVIREKRPDLVLAHDPRTLWRRFGWRSYLGHSDHRASGEAVLNAIYPRATSPNFYREQLAAGLEPWYPQRLWLFDTAEPDLRVRIGAGLDRKLRALARHESQRASAGGLVEAARSVAKRMGEGAEPAEVFVELELRR